jgi:putative ATPase
MVPHCPICENPVKESKINAHLDSNCKDFIESEDASECKQQSQSLSSFLQPAAKRQQPGPKQSAGPLTPALRSKRSYSANEDEGTTLARSSQDAQVVSPLAERSEPGRSVKRLKNDNAFHKAAPLAERMRPRTLDDVCGQELVGPTGVLRGLIESDRVPSMILWGGPGTGKTTIARVIASMVGSRFVEINSTSTGVAECKKIFAEARNELGLTGRKTIIFCDEIHRFSKSQQDVFLGPVESGQITLIGATTENPSFKVQNALLSRCRTFTLSKLCDDDVIAILNRALEVEGPNYSPSSLVNDELIRYLAAFADGDARTALNLLELAMELSHREGMTLQELKKALTRTLVYDRAGDQHYDTISAFHKAIRGSDPDAALYYLARMIQSGEDPLYIARRLIVVASEDIGLADNTMLPLATAAYTAVEKIGLPEARINLAHATVAMALSKKSTRAYRGLNNAFAALQEPGVAGLPIPIHLRNAPTKLMKELGYGREYKYNPDFVDGKVVQDYLPGKLIGRRFMDERDLGTLIDPDLAHTSEDGWPVSSPQTAQTGDNDQWMALAP